MSPPVGLQHCQLLLGVDGAQTDPAAAAVAGRCGNRNSGVPPILAGPGGGEGCGGVEQRAGSATADGVQQRQRHQQRSTWQSPGRSASTQKQQPTRAYVWRQPLERGRESLRIIRGRQRISAFKGVARGAHRSPVLTETCLVVEALVVVITQHCLGGPAAAGHAAVVDVARRWGRPRQAAAGGRGLCRPGSCDESMFLQLQAAGAAALGSCKTR